MQLSCIQHYSRSLRKLLTSNIARVSLCIRGCTPANAYIFAALYTHDVAKYLYIRIQDVSETMQQAIR